MKQDDWRVPLKEGSVLHDKYIVRKCVATGGSCLLYDCWYADSQGNTVDVYVKEFYPKEPENAITRSAEDGKSLKWKIQYLTQKPRRLIKFKEACKHLNLFYKDKSLCMNTTYQQDTFDENETSYNVVAKSFAGVSGDDYENVKTINDILQVVLKLTYVIKEYHQKGYLHLDIKPANYLVAEDASHGKIIQLYDLDSIVPIDQFGHIKPGNSITYTTGFCAPEIEMLEYGFTREAMSQIGTWTDIYSLGMILLNLICGPVPVSFYDSNNDASFYLNSSLYSESPVFENEAGESINPAVQSKVKSILTNCLESFYLDRIQTTPDLINELESAIALCQSPYVLTSIGSSIGCFMGRETELHQIEDRFAKGNGICIAFGPGGTGKTCFAHEYWRRNKSRYNVGVYLDYAGGHDSNDKGGMDGLLSSVELRNYDDNSNSENYEKKRYEKIRELLNKEDVLILLDNFDMPNDPARAKAYKAIFKDLQDNFSNADIIITTRTDLFGMSDGILSSNTTQINIGGLPFEQSFTLFAQNCERDVKGQEESYRKLYDFENGNTLALHILSRLYHKDTHRYNAIEDIYQKLCQGQALGSREVYSEKTAEDALCDIYDIFQLSKEDKTALGVVYLFRRVDLTSEMIYKFYGDDNGDILLNRLDRLAMMGWITKADKFYFLHPLVKYMVQKKISPKIEDYPTLKKHQFYMFFSIINLADKYPDSQGRISGAPYRLESHFEEYEENVLDDLVIPADVPELRDMVHSPFVCLAKGQATGKLGSHIEVDLNNPYYESANNCIFTKAKDGEASTLMFMSIKESVIPKEKNIQTIAGSSCSYNENEKILIPDSVITIDRWAFSGCKSKMIDIPKTVQRVDSEVFRGADGTHVVFHGVPEHLSSSVFNDWSFDKHNKPNYVFDGCNVEWINDCLIDHSNESLLCTRLDRTAECLCIPECVKIVDKPIRFPSVRSCLNPAVKLPAGIEFVSSHALQGVFEIIMSAPGQHYEVVGDNLIRKNADGSGTVVHCWGKLPTQTWINSISDHAFGRNIFEKDPEVLAEREILWKKGLAGERNTDLQARAAVVVIPDNIQTISDYAFVGCVCNVIKLPHTISYIGESALSARDLNVIEFAGTKQEFDMIAKADRWIAGHSRYLSFVFSDCEKSIEEMAEEYYHERREARRREKDN